MKLFNKTLLFLFLAVGTFLQAEDGPIAPPPPGSGGGGGTGPGGVTSPIDMYVYVLALLAIFLIVYFVKKNQKKLI